MFSGCIDEESAAAGVGVFTGFWNTRFPQLLQSNSE